ncbi:LLM class flavin-dependent oxidoreductase [Nocardioides bruguierae]|uniref:LLM class flavin-dependent oxidoreductase n=1 Tax=Nocardioides bruguierae TaxID=2945102 RepID=UPI00201FEFE6|nr:LLM class flavin-dependent oxidoreductase [Nocardioides bruguierae]MCL8025356.1 LLM class flavin-dependent oxidoreductase [Nocardioides bruguierae]
MKYGVFLPTTNDGYIYSHASPSYEPTFELLREITVGAEELGFDFAFSMVKFRGYGDDGDGFMDRSAESLTLMSALSGHTSRIGLWASVGVLSMNPAMVARMAATIQDASGGRFGLNIVGGWNRHEYAPMGVWPGDSYYADRYRYVAEYIRVLRGLWETGRLTHHGEFFDLEDCLVQPTPPSPVPVIMAGQSPASTAAAAELADVSFILGDHEVIADASARLVQGASVFDRTVAPAALLGIIARETDEEAIEEAMRYADHVDRVAMANLSGAARKDTEGEASKGNLRVQERVLEGVTMPDDDRAAVVAGACFFSPQLVGSYERVAASLRSLEASGVDAVALTFPDYVADQKRFAEKVVPLV